MPLFFIVIIIINLSGAKYPFKTQNPDMIIKRKNSSTVPSFPASEKFISQSEK